MSWGALVTTAFWLIVALLSGATAATAKDWAGPIVPAERGVMTLPEQVFALRARHAKPHPAAPPTRGLPRLGSDEIVGDKRAKSRAGTA